MKVRSYQVLTREEEHYYSSEGGLTCCFRARKQLTCQTDVNDDAAEDAFVCVRCCHFQRSDEGFQSKRRMMQHEAKKKV